MTFCGNCGARVEEAVKFCPACGNPMPAQQTPPVQQQAQPAQPQYPEIPPQPAVPLYAEPPAYTPPVMPGAATQADIQDAQENKTMAILAYILFFIPLLTGAHKTSAFAKFHTNQGTVLFITALCYSVLYGVLSVILAFIPVVGWILIMLLGLVSFVFLAFCIVGIVNAANGKMQQLPVIGKFTVIK